MKIFISFIIFVLGFSIRAEPIKLNFQIECLIVAGTSNSYFYAQSILKLNETGTRKLYQIQCMRETKKCFGVDLRLTDSVVGMLGLVPQNFDANVINLSETSATFIYNNVTFTVDTKENKVKMIIFHKRAEKNIEERWEGSCK